MIVLIAGGPALADLMRGDRLASELFAPAQVHGGGDQHDHADPQLLDYDFDPADVEAADED